MKGSRAVDLYKGKGPADGVDSYRVLSIQDHLSKSVHRDAQAQVLDSFEKDNPGDQYGGVAGGSRDVPTHVLQAFAQRATAGGIISFWTSRKPSAWCRGNSSMGCTCGRR